MARYILLILLFSSTLFASAQNPYVLGDKITDFTLLDVTSNGNFQLSTLSEKQIVVIIFTSNDCPYSKLYEERILKLASQYADKNVQFVLVNPNNPQSSPEDNTQNMKAKAQARSYSLPYLADPQQKLATRFGAIRTPEAFVLKNINGNFILKYKGAIDDNPQVNSDVHSFFLRDAIDALLNHDTIKVSEMRATGCLIKK
jgi:peroxiredoxin